MIVQLYGFELRDATFNGRLHCVELSGFIAFPLKYPNAEVFIEPHD